MARSGIPGTATSASVFIGDKVRIEGLATAKKYNGLQGLVVGVVDNETNRCDVRFRHDGIGRVVSIHKRNLVLVHRAKTWKKYIAFTRNEMTQALKKEPCLGGDDLSCEKLIQCAQEAWTQGELKRHCCVAKAFAAKCRSDALVEKNMILLRDFDSVAPDEMTKSIVTKWREQQIFVRFMNGDTRDCHHSNLQVVSLKNAMENIDDWTVDRDMYLSDEETQLVQCPAWRLQLLTAEDARKDDVKDDTVISEDIDKDALCEEYDAYVDCHKLSHSIFGKWKSHGVPFIRFKNGQQCDFSAAMDHIDNWKLDWEKDLTPREVELVRIPAWRAAASQAAVLEPEVRQTYKNWCATYGKVPSEAKFASFKTKYAVVKCQEADAKQEALAAESEYVRRPILHEYLDMSLAESVTLHDRFGTHLWMPQLDKDASDAYDLWYRKHHKEPSNHKFNVFKMNYKWELANSAMVGEPYECISFYLDNKYMDMTEVELAEMRDLSEHE